MKKIEKRVLDYVKNNMTEVMHTTLDPEGPGVVRVHLIPPKVDEEGIESSVAIINGQDIIPVAPAWSILLSEFIKSVNVFSGKEINEDDVNQIMENTCKAVRKVYPLISKKRLKTDIDIMMTTFKQIAYGEPVDEAIDYINIGEYAPFMKAPHRMDLLVSSMCQNGSWHCNQRCVHCYAAGQTYAEEKELSTDEWKKIIDKCRQACIPQITFTGGEPTLRDDLPELIEHAGWFVTRLNTNGIKLTADFCDALKKASLDSCQITFYSCDEVIHNKLVGANQYANTLAGIENALAAGLNISINTPLCSLNKDYISTLEFLKDKGVRYVTCSGLITTGNATGDDSVNLQLGREEIRALLNDAVDYCFNNGMEINFTSPGWIDSDFFEEHSMSEPTCGACLSNMAITPSGNVVPCQSYLSDGIMGNMLENEWSDIWESEFCKLRRDYSAKMLGECPLRRERL